MFEKNRTYAQMNTDAHICTHTHTYIYIYTHIHTYIYKHTVHIQKVYIDIPAHIHTHTYTHTPKLAHTQNTKKTYTHTLM